MPFSEFSHVRLASVCTVVPAEEIRLTDEAACYGNDMAKLERVRRIAGFDRRRIGPPHVTASDLCIQAAERLFRETDTDPASIDTLIFVTQTADYPIPATACIQQNLLGLSTDCAAFDVNLGCSGYVYGLWLASTMIESRACSRVLLLAGEAGFCHLNPANRVTASVFGDAGSASLLEYNARENPLSFSLGTDGNGYEAIIRPGGGARIPHLPADTHEGGYLAEVRDANGQPWRAGTFGNLWMDGATVLDFSMSVVPAHISDHLERKGVSPEGVDYLVLHQANKQIVKSVGLAAGFTQEQVPWETLSKYGNQSSASIPSTLCDQLRDACAERDLHLMLCGYGIGLSWASCLGRFPGIYCSGVHDFVPSGRETGREEHLACWHTKFKGEHDG